MTTTPTTDDDRDYVLGTHDAEIERLALQHRVWRPRTLDGWRRAGFTIGQTILDVGCGPGYATLDLAEIVGSDGRVIAIDRSRRFLDALEAARTERGLDQISAHEIDLAEGQLPSVQADGAWCRWILAFLERPRDLLRRVRDVLRPGAAFVIYEYFDYASWRLAPRSPELEEFVAAVIASWRASGGEPDIALELPRWLEELGFRIVTLQPIVDVVTASNFVWQWPKTFIATGTRRLVELGDLTPERAKAIRKAFADAEQAPHTRMITPAVLEVIAERQ